MVAPGCTFGRGCSLVTCRAEDSCHHHGFDVDELLDAVGRQLAAIAAFLAFLREGRG
jgi:hypothetical protein